MPVDHKVPEVFWSCWNRVPKSCVAYYKKRYVNSKLITLKLTVSVRNVPKKFHSYNMIGMFIELF